MANLPLAFGELLAGGVILTASISGQSVADVFSGNVSLKGLDAGGSSATGGGTPATELPAGIKAVSKGARQGAVSMGDLENIGKQFGWSGSQLEAWWQVIARESGGNPQARNASSGAFGIGQFLGGTLTEYTPYGAASSDPMQQLFAMAKYIHDRYGTPANAWAHEQQYGWY